MKTDNYALLTDLYQLTMAQGYWETGKQNETACFYSFFRENPFKGGFAIASGMAHMTEIIEDFGFSQEDIDYLASLNAPGGGKLFKPEFLDYLKNLELSVDIEAVREGTVVFPNDPLFRVTGPIIECQILETALLNAVNFETLIATKAARICISAQSPVAEFGLRRAQGESGGVRASRAAIVGGCASTSNVLAGQLFNLPVSGTHSHSWVMSFDSELEAFRAYAKAFPTNCVLLVDTYNIDNGIKNAITVGLEMKERGETLAGIRIDSGDLSWQAIRAREALDAAGLTDTGVVLSNDLDEWTIKTIRESGAKVGSWGVGTKLATAYDQPALGGVYKLAAKLDKDGNWVDCIKVTGNTAKLTTPGVLDVRRYFYESGKLAGDMVFDINVGVPIERIVDPADRFRQKKLKGLEYVTLLEPLARQGKVVLPEEYQDALIARDYCKKQLTLLDESQKRLLNPHSYPVGLEYSLFHRRDDLVNRLLGLV